MEYKFWFGFMLSIILAVTSLSAGWAYWDNKQYIRSKIFNSVGFLFVILAMICWIIEVG